MSATENLPTLFESLAGICKFIAAQKMNPDFYAKHQHSVEFASTFLRILASSAPSLEKSFRAALPLTVPEGAEPIRQALSSLTLTQEKMSWFDKQMTEVLRVLVPVVRDPELPRWMSGCKWAIEDAFESQ